MGLIRIILAIIFGGAFVTVLYERVLTEDEKNKILDECYNYEIH